MFNLLLALVTGVIIGWNFHAFFIKLNPQPLNILETESTVQLNSEKALPPPITEQSTEIETLTSPPKMLVEPTPAEEETNQTETNSSETSTPVTENFYTLLENELFSDAMSFYVDAEEANRLLYHATLLDYFEKKLSSEPQVTIEQMLELQELESKERRVEQTLLDSIEYDDKHTENALQLLELIKEKSNPKETYEHTIPLEKVGEHFTVEVQINDTALTLLLDTGASLTMVSDVKLPILTLLKDNIVLNTAAGKVNAQLKEADTFSMGEIELEKFQVVSASFDQETTDGLLGMNFLKEFTFNIDQENAVLHLSKKVK